MSQLVVLRELTKNFGPLVAVDHVSMSVGAGEVLGFLGPNGAGKTTTMRMVAGFMEPSSGSAEVCGHDVRTEAVEVKRHIGFLPEGAPTYGDMTPAAYLDFIAELRGFDGAERRRRVRRVVETVELQEVLDQPIETLSKGFKRRVGLAQAMLHDPPVLILDEPTDGLDPNQKRHVRGLIREMARDKAIIISTHILEEVEAVCTRAAVIARGRLLADGTPEDLRARAPDHNVVLLTLETDSPEEARRTVLKLAQVEEAIVHDRKDGAITLRVVPRGGRPIAVALGDLFREKGIAVSELVVEKGSLDEAFHRITSEAERAEAHHAQH